MKCFLRDGDEVIADNIKLIYSNGTFVVPENGLNHCIKYVFDVPTELECELLFEPTKDMPDQPYYDKPEID
jgi:hypothetical protein